MPVDFNSKPSYFPIQQRLRMPADKNDVSIYLLSDSFEYDIQMINKLQPPKINYRHIIIPHRFVDKINGRIVRYILSQNDYNKKISHIQAQKFQPPVIPFRFPYKNSYSENLYIPMSDIMNIVNPVFKNMSVQFIQDNIFNIFGLVMNKFSYSKKKIFWIDCRRVKIYKNPNMKTFQTDLINALLTAFVINPINKIKRENYIFVFSTPESDYKFDMSQYEDRDKQRLRRMISQVGTDYADEEPEEAGSDENKPAESLEQIEADANKREEENKQTSELVDNLGKPEYDIKNITQQDEKLQQIQATHASVTRDIKTTLSSLFNQFSNNDELPVNQIDVTQRNRQQLYDAKAFDINAQLQSRINPDEQVNQQRVDNLQNDLNQLNDSPVEKEIIDNAAKKIANEAQPANTVDVLNSTSSPREEKLRQQMGQLKLNNVTFNKLVSISDVPKPAPLRPLKMTTTNSAAKVGSQFVNTTKEYENKLMDRDIVATLMNLSKPSDGFYVTNVEITDVSNVTALVNDWKITLKSKVNGLQNVIHIRIPKMDNGRFFVNGTWYTIDKQDFPLPVLKINSKTVIITSNYNKITVARYDTKSLVDLMALRKVIDKQLTPDGKQNKYVKPGSNINSNSHYISTIEFDEFAKIWYSIKIPESGAEFCFNRTDCLKNWKFVSVNTNEFCCGMINQVPVVVNVDTGYTRQGKTLVQTIVDVMPEAVQQEFYKTKPGKTSMYATIKIGGTVPLGVAIAAWEGITSLLKASGVEYKMVEPRFKDPSYIIYPFKDQTLAVKNTILGQLLFNGFYRINTRAYNFSDFEVPITESNSVYVDIFNQLFFSQYTQLTTFITYHNFFMDAITADVCNHYNIPNTLTGILIYATNLLCDNTYKNEFSSSLYRIRCSEIIPAMIHYHLAVEMSKYNNRVGSKSRKSKFVFNPNAIIQELTNLETCNQISALNPTIELHARETVSTKGFRGVNNTRAYSEARRSYNPTMIGKIAMSSPNSANVGMQRQLTADPKIESVRGYTSTASVDDTTFNDMQLASFSELLTPGTVSRDDAIRVAMACSQSGHIVSTNVAQPALISNGVDELVPAYLTDEFSVIAEDDGKVLEIADGYMIVQYKNQEKKAINVGNKMGFNTGSGFYVNNTLLPNFQPNDTFKKNDILAYHAKFFSKDSMGQIRFNIGPLAKVAFYGNYFTYEDSGAITTKMSKKLSTTVIMKQIIKLDATEDVDKIVSVGDEIEIGSPLLTFGLGATGDKSVDNFLKAFGAGADDDSFKRVIKADHAGVIADIKIYTNKSLDKLSPSLFNIVDSYFKANRKARKVLDKYDNTSSVYKLGTLYDKPTEPLKTQTIKGINTDVLIEFYIAHDDEASVGDKCVDYGACKQIISEVIPEGMEPFSEYRPDEEISLFQAPSSILKRMVPSLVVNAAGNKVLIELKRQCKDIWESAT